MFLILHQSWLQNQVQGIMGKIKNLFISLEPLVITWVTTTAFKEDVTSCRSSKACVFIIHILHS